MTRAQASLHAKLGKDYTQSTLQKHFDNVVNHLRHHLTKQDDSLDKTLKELSKGTWQELAARVNRNKYTKASITKKHHTNKHRQTGFVSAHNVNALRNKRNTVSKPVTDTLLQTTANRTRRIGRQVTYAPYQESDLNDNAMYCQLFELLVA